MLGTAACGTKSGEQPQGNTVKAETVTMPNFSNAPIADEYAIFDTNYGQFKVRLLGSKAPITVKNFDYLVKKGFYNGVTFHRVIEGFMIQGGDPDGTGAGGPGYTIPDEFSNDLQFNKMCVLAMANRGPNTGGSQFFITLGPTDWLDNKHTIFGTVVQGMDAVSYTHLKDTAAFMTGDVAQYFSCISGRNAVFINSPAIWSSFAHFVVHFKFTTSYYCSGAIEEEVNRISRYSPSDRVGTKHSLTSVCRNHDCFGVCTRETD